MTKEVPLTMILHDIKKKHLSPEQACDKHGLNFVMLPQVYREYFVAVYQKV